MVLRNLDNSKGGEIRRLKSWYKEKGYVTNVELAYDTVICSPSNQSDVVT